MLNCCISSFWGSSIIVFLSVEDQSISISRHAMEPALQWKQSTHYGLKLVSLSRIRRGFVQQNNSIPEWGSCVGVNVVVTVYDSVSSRRTPGCRSPRCRCRCTSEPCVTVPGRPSSGPTTCGRPRGRATRPQQSKVRARVCVCWLSESWRGEGGLIQFSFIFMCPSGTTCQIIGV